VGRRVEHRAFIVHRHLLHLEPQIIHDALDLGTPRTDVLGRGLQSDDMGLAFIGNRVGGADELEVGEAFGDVGL
jgi:hypothetical protein